MSDQTVDMLEAVQRPHVARLQAEVQRLRAYAMALRGDLVEIDTALSEGDDDRVADVVTRHIAGTLDEDVAALAGESRAVLTYSGGGTMLPLPNATSTIHLESACRQLLIRWDVGLEVPTEVGQIGLQLDLGDIVGLRIVDRRANGTIEQILCAFQDVPAGAHTIRGVGTNVVVVSSALHALPIVT